jgi:hypothetical protein
MPLHDAPCIWPQEACICQPDGAARCSQCNGAGCTSGIGCCGNGTPSGECCGNGVEVQEPCEHCQTTGIEPSSGCPHCDAGHDRLVKPDGAFHDVVVNDGFRIVACTNSNPQP